MILPGDSYFKSAIMNERGDVDIGYYSLGWGLRGWGLSCLVLLGIGAMSTWRAPGDAAAIITAMGVAIGAITGALATMLAAVGLFLWGDKANRATVGTTTTTAETATKLVTEIAPPSKGKP